MRPIVSVLVVAALASPVWSDRVSGFTAPPARALDGRVTDAAGHPVAGAEVHVVTGAGERVVKTDRAGRYHVERARDDRGAIVFVYGDVRVGGVASVSAIDADAEVIEMHDVIPPAQPPRARSSDDLVLAYTDAARDANAWTRAWLRLDLDDAGTVARVQILNHAGYGLDDLAVRAAFRLRFEAARDNAGRAIPAQVLWSFEWPEYEWLLARRLSEDNRHVPRAAADVPCRGTGPTHSTYRDCSPPNLANALREPWIARPR